MKSRTALWLLIVVLLAFGGLFWLGIRQIDVRDSGRGATEAPETRPEINASPRSSNEGQWMSERQPRGKTGNVGTLDDVVLPSLDAPQQKDFPVELRASLEKAERPDLLGKRSGKERIVEYHETLQIPAEELPELPSQELLRRVVTTPLRTHIYMFPQPDGGLKRFSRDFNGVDAFLERTDAARVTTEAYRQLVNQIPTRAAEKGFTFRFPTMEVLLSSDRILNELSNSELQAVVGSLVASVEARSDYDGAQPAPVFGESCIEYTALAMSKCLSRLGVRQYTSWYAQREPTGLFESRPATYEEAKQIIAMGRAYAGE